MFHHNSSLLIEISKLITICHLSMSENQISINGLSKVAKGDNIKQDPKACEKYPEAC